MQHLNAVPLLQLVSEPAPKLVIDDPLPEQLAMGLVVVQYRTENLRIIPVFGSAAMNVSPRIGHLHITVDDAPWHWVDSSNEPIVINGLQVGTHRILVEMADPLHKVIDHKTITFIIPNFKRVDQPLH